MTTHRTSQPSLDPRHRPTTEPATGPAAGLAERLRAAAAATTGLRPPSFESADVAYALHDTALGRLLVAATDSGAVVACLYAADTGAQDAALTRLVAAVSPRVLRLPGRLDAVRRQLDDYLAGSRRAFDLPLDLALATPFQATVLTTLAERVGYGERTAYGRLAGWVGRPAAARAVGAALGGNPLCVLLPCHRVVGASGALTGYAGGLAAKRLLLDLESPAGAAVRPGRAGRPRG